MRNRLDALLAAAVGLGGFFIYARTLAPGLLPADAGEFQLAAPLLGVVHPTGYPLYLILGKVFTALVPLGDLAYRRNLLSSVFSALTVAAVYAGGRRLTGRRAPAALAALTLAFSRTFWSQAVEAEVYALNSLFVAGMFLLLLPAASDQRPAATRAALPPADNRLLPTDHCLLPTDHCLLPAAFLYGLSLTHHRTMILLAPAFAVYLWLERKHLAPADSLTRSFAHSLILLCLPLLLYLYIPFRAPATPYLYLPLAPGRELVLYHNTPADFMQLVSGSGFGGDLHLSGLAGRLALAWNLFQQQFGLAGVLLAILGLLALLKNGGTRGTCWPRFLLLALSYSSIVAFCLVYRIGDVADFFTPSYIVFALWIGIGADRLLSTIQAAAASPPSRGNPRSKIIFVLLFLLPISLLVSNFPLTDRSGDDTRQQWLKLLGQPIPENAILLTNDRDEMMPLWYLQYVEGQRPDLLGLFPLILPEKGYANIVRLLDTVSDTGRPLYLIKPMPGLEIRYSSHQERSLYRIEGPVRLDKSQRPITADLGQVHLLGADVTTTTAGTAFAVTLWWQGTGAATEDYHVFVHLVDAQDQTVAQSDHRPGGDLYPTSLWQAGETLRDEHHLAVPPPGMYELRVGMYDTRGRLRVVGGGDSVGLGQVRFYPAPSTP